MSLMDRDGKMLSRIKTPDATLLKPKYSPMLKRKHSPMAYAEPLR
jgi:hypothetical protein